MFSKKIILILTVLILLFSIGSAAYALKRDIGGGRYSECTKNAKGTYDCTCQSANKVENGELGKLITDPVCAFCGDCTLNNFLELGVNISKIILKYLGVFALLMFVIGGVIWITSGGSSEKVQLGKKIISGAVVGMVIVLGAVLIVRVAGDLVGVDVEEYLVVEEAKKGETPPVSEEEKEGLPKCSPPAEIPWSYGSVQYPIGCQSQDVAGYQNVLIGLGCNCGSSGADGNFGGDTKACTQDFQRAVNRILTVESETFYQYGLSGLQTNGVVDDKTYNYAVSSYYATVQPWLDLKSILEKSKCK